MSAGRMAILGVVLALGSLLDSAPAEVIEFTDGRKAEGVILREKPGAVEMRLNTGAIVSVPRERIKSIGKAAALPAPAAQAAVALPAAPAKALIAPPAATAKAAAAPAAALLATSETLATFRPRPIAGRAASQPTVSVAPSVRRSPQVSRSRRASSSRPRLLVNRSVGTARRLAPSAGSRPPQGST